jgi:hypothetical protein
MLTAEGQRKSTDRCTAAIPSIGRSRCPLPTECLQSRHRHPIPAIQGGANTQGGRGAGFHGYCSGCLNITLTSRQQIGLPAWVWQLWPPPAMNKLCRLLPLPRESPVDSESRHVWRRRRWESLALWFLMVAAICIGWVGALRPLVEHPVHITVALGTTRSRPGIADGIARSSFLSTSKSISFCDHAGSGPGARPAARVASWCEAESSRRAAGGAIPMWGGELEACGHGLDAADGAETSDYMDEAQSVHLLCIMYCFFLYIYEELYVPLRLSRL